MEYAERIHFCSFLSGVSLELPVGFEEQDEDESTLSVIYADDLDDDEPGAKVMAKMITVPSAGSDAFLRLAEESRKLPGRNCVKNESLTLDGLPAARQILGYRDVSLNIDVIRHETYAQKGDTIYSVISIGPASREAEYLPEFIRASDSIRFVHPPDFRKGGCFTHPGLQISVQVPDGWSVSEPADGQVRFFGEPHGDHDDYRPTLSITLGEPEGHGGQWFDQFCRDRLKTIETEYLGFNLVSEDRYSISSLAEADVIVYVFEPEPGFAVAQLQALIYADRYRMYLITGSTLLPLQDAHIPVFGNIPGSLRILPPS